MFFALISHTKSYKQHFGACLWEKMIYGIVFGLATLGDGKYASDTCEMQVKKNVIHNTVKWI